MQVATYILFVLGCLGATDILLYHCISHGIRSHQDSRLELVVHSLRGPTYATLFIFVPNFAMHGFFFWLLLCILFFDLCISIVDFILERSSRAFFGGLPSGEYVLHILLAMLFGAMVTSIFYDAGQWSTLTTALLYEPAQVPSLLRYIMMVMAVLVLGTAAMDLKAVWHLTRNAEHESKDK